MPEETRPPRRRRKAPKQIKGDGENPSRSLLMMGVLLGIGILLVVFSGFQVAGSHDALGSTDFHKLLEKNEVKEITFRGEEEASVILRAGDLKGDGGLRERVLTFINKDDASKTKELIEQLAVAKKIDTEIRPVQHPNQFLPQLLLWSILLLFGALLLWWVISRQMRAQGGPGNVLNFGKSRHRIAARDKTGVTLDDVAGCDEAKDEVKEIIEFLKNPKKFSRLGGRIPKGVLLIGQPGTGKTLLAKAAAGEADVPFFSVCGSDFVEMFVGVGASRVRDLFEKAKENSPCILFLDEVDAVGRRRGSGLGGGHDEREQTLNQILVEMDGFDTDKGIIVVAATNRPDILDPALLRPGRFDRQIVLDLPDVKGREQILKVHARNVKLDPEVDLRRLAQATTGFSGAELEAVVNEAALRAALEDRNSIVREDLEEARDKVRWGRQKKSRTVQEDDRRATAYHEGGHALVAAKHDAAMLVHKVSIIPRGATAGVTMFMPAKDQIALSKKQAMAQVAIAFGGRIGEVVATNDVSTGAANDIEQATGIARRMVCEWGMSDELGPINFSQDKESGFGPQIPRAHDHSEATAQKIDAEVKKIVDQGYKRAQEILTKHKDALDRIAEALLRYESITGEEVMALAGGRSVLELRPEEVPLTPVVPIVEEPAVAEEPEREPRREALGGGPTPAGALA